ncbi:MAG: hypothetical protein AB7G75_09535 [Candidatus Binatia bacterium]
MVVREPSSKSHNSPALRSNRASLLMVPAIVYGRTRQHTRVVKGVVGRALSLLFLMLTLISCAGRMSSGYPNYFAVGLHRSSDLDRMGQQQDAVEHHQETASSVDTHEPQGSVSLTKLEVLARKHNPTLAHKRTLKLKAF